MGDFHLKLSDEPELGKWHIQVKTGTEREGAYFTVEEYVLPKYEVTIEPPAYVTITTPSIDVKVCAKYVL